MVLHPDRGGVLLCALVSGLAVSQLPSSAQVVRTSTLVLYETGFEAFEGFSANQDLAGQGSWLGAAGTLLGDPAPIGGNGILKDPVPGFQGQYAYIGFAAATNTADFNLWRPVNLKPTTEPRPLIRFRVSMQIQDSTLAAPQFDDFRWSIYNTENHRLLSLDFDNETREVNFILDGAAPEITPTGFSFMNGVPYDLEIDLNLQRNLWSAWVNGTLLVNAQPITTEDARLSFGDADAVWVIRQPGKPGDNYMIFDDYRITLEPLSDIRPTLEPIGMLNNGAFVVRVWGEPGVTYRLEASDNLQTWFFVASGTAQSPGGFIDLQDPTAAASTARSYRALSVP